MEQTDYHGMADDEWCLICGESLPCSCYAEDERENEDDYGTD